MEPTLNDLMIELRALRQVVERHLPEAVSSREERVQQYLKDQRRKSSAEKAAAKAAGRLP